MFFGVGFASSTQPRFGRAHMLNAMLPRWRRAPVDHPTLESCSNLRRRDSSDNLRLLAIR